METRITSRITHADEQEREYYHTKAKELGFKSFVDFAKASMQKAIEEDDYVVNQLRKIADESEDMIKMLDIQEETKPWNEEEAEAREIAELVYNLAIHSKAMVNSPSNQVYMNDPVYLEGEAPRYQYKYPLMYSFKVSDYTELNSI